MERRPADRVTWAPGNGATTSFAKSLTRRSSSSKPAISPGTPSRVSVDEKPEEKPQQGNTTLLVSLAALIATGVINRVLYKMTLVPLGNYPFFLAQFQTFGYVLVYCSVLWFRYKSGIVTKDMLQSTSIKLFAAIGLFETMSQLLGFIGAAQLPGVVLPLLQQSVMFFNLLLTYTILHKPLQRAQVSGALLVVAGVVTAAWPSDSGASVLSDVNPLYVGVFVASMFFPALASILKEKLFGEAEKKLGSGRKLDIFVVNSATSCFQALFVLLCLPLLASLRGIAVSDLPNYLVQGSKCFMGMTPECGSNCAGAPLLPLAYVAFNLAFNVAALNVLRSAGAVVSSIGMATLTPLTIWAFTFDWPYLPGAPPLGANFLLGAAILTLGLVSYNLPSWKPKIKEWLGKSKAKSA